MSKKTKKSIKRLIRETEFAHEPADGNVENIRILDLSHSKLVTFPPNSIKQYFNLKVLVLRNLNLKKIPDEVFSLKYLEKLFLGGNDIEEIPPEICQLANIKELQLSNNKISNIPDVIVNLKKLSFFWINENNLEGIPESILKLKELKKIYLSNNKINELPKGLVDLPKLNGIYLSGNPLRKIPIYDFRGNSLNKLKTYFQSIEGGVDKSFEAKIIVLGNGAVGKSTMVEKLSNNLFNPKSHASLTKIQETKGVDVKDIFLEEVKINNRTYNIKVKLWDFGGQEIQSEVHHLFLSNQTLYLILWANRTINDKDTYLKKWLNKVEVYGDKGSQVIIVQTMYNEPDTSYSVINRENLRKAFFPLIVGFSNISSFENIGIFNKGGLKSKIVKSVLSLPHVGKEISINWVEVKNQINQIKSYKKVIYIGEYFSLCSKKSISKSEAKLLLSWLHNIGEVLYYDTPRAVSKTLFLDPNWVTSIVYKIMLDDDKKIFNNKGIFTFSDLENLLNSEEEIIIDLMEKFNLCFNIDNKGNKYILPTLLPLYQQYDLSFFTESKNIIKFKLTYKVFPKSILPRFISKSYKEDLTYNDYFWKDGVVLEIKSSYIIVYTDTASKEMRDTIFIDIYGIDKWYALERVRELFKSLNKGNAYPTESILCSSSLNCAEKTKNYFNIDYVNRANEKNIDSIQCVRCFKNIPVKSLISDIDSGLNDSHYDIKKYLLNGLLEKAIDTMIALADRKKSATINQLIPLKGRFNQLNEDKNLGVIKYDDFEIVFNKMYKSANELFNQLGKEVV